MEGDVDFRYDQIVSFGELISSRIVAKYLDYSNLPNTWIDARNYIKTDNTFREAKVQWEETEKRITKLNQSKDELIITPGTSFHMVTDFA